MEAPLRCILPIHFVCSAWKSGRWTWAYYAPSGGAIPPRTSPTNFNNQPGFTRKPVTTRRGHEVVWSLSLGNGPVDSACRRSLLTSAGFGDAVCAGSPWRRRMSWYRERRAIEHPTLLAPPRSEDWASEGGRRVYPCWCEKATQPFFSFFFSDDLAGAWVGWVAQRKLIGVLSFG